MEKRRGGEGRKEDEEGEKDESRIPRDRAVDIVNGRERSGDLENKIAED